MTPFPTTPHLQTFRDLVERELGLSFDLSSPKLLGEVMSDRLAQLGLEADDYLQRLPGDRQEQRHLARRLTVNESYFFRHMDQLQAFACEALVEASRARLSLPIRIASVGCSSGEEPYSLAMLALAAGIPRDRLAITGFDIDPGALERAKSARYSAWSLRETPTEMRLRWFRQESKEIVLEPWVRDTVDFAEANLIDASCPHWAPKSYDIIFCRNVLMYFSAAQVANALGRLQSALAPGGSLFLGHAEHLRGAQLEGFELVSAPNSFYYIKSPLQAPSIASTPGAVLWPSRPEELDPQPNLRPLEAIQNELAQSRKLSQARLLLQAERFAEARRILLETDGDLLERAEALLLYAVVLVHLGEFAQAEEICRRLPRHRQVEAGGRYLLGLCHEARADYAAAIAEHQHAVCLDPSFAMPRIQLALLAQRRGEHKRATREFEIARQLLHREPPARLELFAVGFTRQALLELCERVTP